MGAAAVGVSAALLCTGLVSGETPDDFYLGQNDPNPFCAGPGAEWTSIRYLVIERHQHPISMLHVRLSLVAALRGIGMPPYAKRCPLPGPYLLQSPPQDGLKRHRDDDNQSVQQLCPEPGQPNGNNPGFDGADDEAGDECAKYGPGSTKHRGTAQEHSRQRPQRKSKVVQTLRNGIGFLLKKNKVDLVYVQGCTYLTYLTSETTRPLAIKTIVGLNPIMVDATGMCGVCRVSIDGVTKFTCVDGPDFDGHQVDWDLLMARQTIYLEEEERAREQWGHEHVCGAEDA